MKQTVKKFFGIALCILLLLSLLPVQALAAQQDVGSILQEAYALDVGECLPYDVTLTGTIINIRTPYDTYYCNITVDIQIPGYELMPVQCYRLSGAGVESLLLGDTITVTGCLTNYNGTIEFMQGCTLDAVISEGGVPAPMPPDDEQWIVDAAYELAPGEVLPYVPTLTGTVVDIVSPYDENYRNITVLMVVEGKEDKPITCYRMKGEGVEALQVGDVITVHGTLQNYAKYDYETGELMYTTVEFYIPTLMSIQGDRETKVYCYAPADWSQCYAYCWSYEGYIVGYDWPGALMTEENECLWSFEVDADADYIIFNNGGSDSGDLTDDLVIPVDDEILYVVDNGTWELLDYYFYNPPVDDWGPDSLALVGDGLPGIPVWYPEAPEGDMKEVADNVYEKTLQVPAGTTMCFKIAGNDCWDDKWNFGCGEIVLNQLLELECGAGALDMSLCVERDCTLRFTVDLNPMRYGENATMLVEEIESLVTYRKLTVFAPDGLGDLYAYGWEPEEVALFPGIRMEQMGDRYEAQIPDNMVNLMLYWEIGDDEWIGSDHMVLDTDGTDVEVTMDEYGNCTVVYVYSTVATYRVVGNASWMGYWDAASDLGKMQQLSTNKYQKIFRKVQPGNYEFKITKDGKWDDVIGDTYGQNFCIYVDEVCDVSVTLTFLNGVSVVRIEYLDTLIGDVTGDGALNLGDIAKLYAHIRGSSILTNESALHSADFTRDGKLNIGDTAGLYAYVRGTDKTSVVDAAYRLDENQELPLEYTLEGEVIGVVEPYDRVRDCITVSMIVAGRENYPILCTRLTGENAKDITSGDRITVTGRIHNFYGIVEFKEGCRLEKWEDIPNETEQMWQWVDQAYALEINESMDQTVTLEGEVLFVERPDDPNARYINVTILVEGREDKPIYCYRMVGSDVSLVGEGDLICVTGTLRNYNGTVEFAAGCQLDMGLILD